MRKVRIALGLLAFVALIGCDRPAKSAKEGKTVNLACNCPNPPVAGAGKAAAVPGATAGIKAEKVDYKYRRHSAAGRKGEHAGRRKHAWHHRHHRSYGRGVYTPYTHHHYGAYDWRNHYGESSLAIYNYSSHSRRYSEGSESDRSEGEGYVSGRHGERGHGYGYEHRYHRHWEHERHSGDSSAANGEQSYGYGGRASGDYGYGGRGHGERGYLHGYGGEGRRYAARDTTRVWTDGYGRRHVYSASAVRHYLYKRDQRIAQEPERLDPWHGYNNDWD